MPHQMTVPVHLVHPSPRKTPPVTSPTRAQEIAQDLEGMLRDLDQKTADDKRAFQMALSDPRATAIRERLYTVILQRTRLRDDLVARLIQVKFLALIFDEDI